MVSVLLFIGSLNLFNMVPRGKIEPEFVVGHTRIKDNPNYKYLHVRDDITYGGIVNYLTPLHAARVTEPAVTWPVSRLTCSNEWPPWPNIWVNPAPKCSAYGPGWINDSKYEGDNFWDYAAKQQQDLDHLKPFKVAVNSEGGFLEKIRIETQQGTQRNPLAKSELTKVKANQMSGLTQGYPRATAAAEFFPHFSDHNSLDMWLMALAMANLTSLVPP